MQWGANCPARLELVTGSAEALATYGVKPVEPERGSRQEIWPGDP